MQEERNKITIKVNGKDKPVKEIKKDSEIAAALDNRSEDEPFDWVLPKDDQSSNVIHFVERQRNEDQQYDTFFTERTPGLPIHRKRKKIPLPQSDRQRLSLQLPKKFLAPIIGAIVVGGIIGFIVLMIFTGEKYETQTPASAQSDLLTQTQSKEEEGKPAGGSEESGTTSTIDLSLETYIVQGGVFSNSDNADEQVDRITANGFAAVRSDEENRVFIGIAPTIEDAKRLAEEYDTAVPDAYPKGWTIEASSVPIPKGNDLSWVREGNQLFAQLIQGKPENVKDLSGTINDWKKKALKGVEKLPSEHQEKAVAFINSLSTIPDNSDSEWDYQQGLLELFIAYQSFVTELKG